MRRFVIMFMGLALFYTSKVMFYLRINLTHQLISASISQCNN